jgi:hypothetical protein
MRANLPSKLNWHFCMMSLDWIGDREVITDVFILDLIFRNMVHVDFGDSVNGGVVEG